MGGPSLGVCFQAQRAGEEEEETCSLAGGGEPQPSPAQLGASALC